MIEKIVHAAKQTAKAIVLMESAGALIGAIDFSQGRHERSQIDAARFRRRNKR